MKIQSKLDYSGFYYQMCGTKGCSISFTFCELQLVVLKSVSFFGLMLIIYVYIMPLLVLCAISV